MPSASTHQVFELELVIKNDVGDVVAFKQDGERFKVSGRTLKFSIDTRYKITITARPAVEFHSLSFAGCDMALHSAEPRSGVYTSEWNTTGMVNLTSLHYFIQGPGGLLKRQIQAKLYKNGDSHADWGHKLGALIWKCSTDSMGNVTVSEESVS